MNRSAEANPGVCQPVTGTGNGESSRYEASNYAPSPVQAAEVENPHYMVPASHVCRNNTVNISKQPNPQKFLQSDCLKCDAEPQQDPVLFMPFEPRTRVEQNPKFYKYMPKELLHYVPPAGKPLNRDFPASVCFDVFD